VKKESEKRAVKTANNAEKSAASENAEMQEGRDGSKLRRTYRKSVL